MNFKKHGWRIDSRSLIDFEWTKKGPKLIIHEKYEKHIKWILRILTFVGVATSLISLEWYESLMLTLILLLLEQFIERSVFEYTTMIVQKTSKFRNRSTAMENDGLRNSGSQKSRLPSFHGARIR